MWRPSFEYTLPINYFSKQQCSTLQKIFTGPFLSKMGISSKTSRKLIFAPYHYSGLPLQTCGYNRAYNTYSSSLATFVTKTRWGTSSKLTLTLCNYSSDIPPPPLSCLYQDIAPIAPPSWITTTWEFLNDINGKVTFTDPWNLPLDRQGDCHIVPQVLSRLVHIPKPLLSKAELQKFNLCCIYLQVLTLSDIATSSGKEIDCHFWRGHRSFRKSSLKWPHQIRPSSACWAI